MNSENIWDRVLVVDGLIDLKIADDYANYLESLGDWSLAYIDILEEDKRLYDDGSGVYQTPVDNLDTKYTDALFNSKILPQLPNTNVEHSTRLHSMKVGSLMAIHTDKLYSLAVTTYLSDCSGGDLVVEHPDRDEIKIRGKLLTKAIKLRKIKPKRGRTVILKCDTPHSVLEVKDGERRSLQTFITYYNKGDQNEQVCDG